MVNRSAKLLLASIAIILSAVLLIGAGPLPTLPKVQSSLDRFTGNPGSIRPTPSVAWPGEAVTITVTLDQATATDQEVGVATSDTGLFVSFPSSVTVPAGSDTVSFVVYVKGNAQQSNLSLSAHCNGTAVCAAMAVTIPPTEIRP